MINEKLLPLSMNLIKINFQFFNLKRKIELTNLQQYAERLYFR